LKGIVPALILLGTFILIPNPRTLVGFDDLAATLLAAFIYWRQWKGKKSEGAESPATPSQSKKDSWFANLIALVWGSHEFFQRMTPGWRKLIRGSFLAFGLSILIVLIVGMIWLYGQFNPAPTSLTPTPIPTFLPKSEIPFEGFANATPTSGIPLEGFESTGAAPGPDNVITLEYPGRVGIYDWIWQTLGYSLEDANNPKGSFVCVYLADVRASGIEATWKKNTAAPLTILISQQTIEVCGGVR
jgi:hypothetical protein